jgi:HSP20 family molecular chaperone IbpA
MTVSLPERCRKLDADNLVVKANRSGTRLRIVSEGGGRDSYDDDGLNEQFTLPVVVDPYSVTARLEHDQLLVIDAPVV